MVGREPYALAKIGWLSIGFTSWSYRYYLCQEFIVGHLFCDDLYNWFALVSDNTFVDYRIFNSETNCIFFDNLCSIFEHKSLAFISSTYDILFYA
jgi:hypothetical protein